MAFDDIEGYGLRRALGAGSVGSVWLARDLSSGRPVAIKRLAASAVPAVELFRRDLALAQGLDHPHVVRLLEIRQAEREWLLVSEFVAAGTLTELLERRGPLRTRELVTLLGPVAEALAAAHRTGLTHGHLGGGDILLTADGRPMLADLGLRLTTTGPDLAPRADGPDPAPRADGPDAAPDAAGPGPADATTAADDLAALRRLALDAGGDPEVFVEALFSGDSTAVAERLLGLAGAEPIALGFGDETDHDPAGRTGDTRDFGAKPARRARPGERSLWARRAVVVGVVALVTIAVGTVGGLAIAASQRQATTANAPAAAAGPSTPAPTAGEPTAEPDQPTPVASTPVGPRGVTRSVAAWTATLTALDVRRADAFARLDANALDGVYVPGSAPWRSDRALLASYRDRRLTVRGLRISIRSVAVQRSSAGEVVLRVADRFTGATAAGADGRRYALPAGRTTTRLITLSGQADNWRISAIVQA